MAQSFFRSDFVPVVTLQKARTARSPTQLNLDNPEFPDYLRKQGISGSYFYEDVTYNGSGLMTLQTMPLTVCVPTVNNQLIPRSEYVYPDSDTLQLINPLYLTAGTVVRFWESKLFYRYSNAPIASSQKSLYDFMGTKYVMFQNRIRGNVKRYSLLTVGVRHENCPDIIANDYYGTPDLWWVVMQYNGLVFPEEITTGRTIKIPDVSEVRAWLTKIRRTEATSKGAPTEFAYQAAKVRL